MIFNCDLLASLTSKMFELAMDDRLSCDEQQQALILGKKLRADWLNLVTAVFNEDTPLFKEATAQLETATEAVQEAKENVDKIAKALELAAGLLTILDRLLGIGIKFL